MKIQYIAERIYPDSKQYPDGLDIKNPKIETLTQDDNIILKIGLRYGIKMIMTNAEARLLVASLQHGSNTIKIINEKI